MTKTLPPFCTEFFVGSNHELLPGPGLPMLMISLFFRFQKGKSGFFQNGTNGFYIRSLDQITVTDLEEYMEYLKYRFNEHNQKLLIKNGELCARSLPLKAFITTFSVQKN